MRGIIGPPIEKAKIANDRGFPLAHNKNERFKKLSLILGLTAVIAGRSMALDTPGEGRWYPVFQGQLVKVEANRTLYERRKDEDCFVALRVVNLTDRPVGMDLRKFWDVIYPNSWGFSMTSMPGAVNEERMIRKSMPESEKRTLMADYSANRLTTIAPRQSMTYFRQFTIGHNIRKEIDSNGNRYLIVGLDGTLRITDGKVVDEVIFPLNGGGAAFSRWIAVQLPAHWERISRNSLVVEEHR